MEPLKCAWGNLFDGDNKKSLERGLLITGIISTILGLWLNLSILLSKLRLDRSYRNFANFTSTACLRRAVQLIVPLIKYIMSMDELGPKTCKFFAFVETFLAVMEVEWLTHVCIERYVIAKYTVNGWPIHAEHYRLFRRLCYLFACMYSLPAFFGIGQYGSDFSCSTCTFDMRLPHSAQKYFVVFIFIFRSIKPAIFMVVMLTMANIWEKRYIHSEETTKAVAFTKNVIIVFIVNLFCWTPIAMIRGDVVYMQLKYPKPIVTASALYIKWAMWLHWVAPTFTAIVLFFMDHRIRNNMLCKTEEIENKEE